MGDLAVITHRQAMPSLVSSLGDVERVAVAMAKSGAFGVKDPNTALILCLLAHDEGRSPVAAARDYHVIQGTPAKKADAMLRDFLASGGHVEWHELTDDRAEATFSHPSGGVARIDWDKARVAQAQLGSNPMHKKYPRQMLRSRVISEGVRTVFPGATSGMYVPEEVADFADAPSRVPTPTATPLRREAAKQIAAPAETPSTIDPDTGEIVDEKRDAAAGWVARTVLAINGAPDREALAVVQTKRAKALGDVREAYPDLAEQVDAAFAARLAGFDVADDGGVE